MLELMMHSGAGMALIDSGMEQFSEDPAGVFFAVTLWILLFMGSMLMLLAAVGLIRLPDLPTRMHASTKAGSLGAALIMLAVAVAMPSADVWARAIAVIAFLLLTAPVAAHVIGRAGYFVGVPLWEGTVKDDLADQYDYANRTLKSGSLKDREIDGFDDEVKVEDEADSESPERAWADEPAVEDVEQEVTQDASEEEEATEESEDSEEKGQKGEKGDKGEEGEEGDIEEEASEEEEKKKADKVGELEAEGA